MTVLADLSAITMTANAKSVVSAKGADLTMLVANAKSHITELQAMLKQIISTGVATRPTPPSLLLCWLNWPRERSSLGDRSPAMMRCHGGRARCRRAQK